MLRFLELFFGVPFEFLGEMLRSVVTFFGDITPKTPVVAGCMFFGLILGAGYGVHVTQRGWEDGNAIGFLICAVVALAAGGCFLGLVAGIVVESIVHTITGADTKKDKRRSARRK